MKYKARKEQTELKLSDAMKIWADTAAQLEC